MAICPSPEWYRCFQTVNWVNEVLNFLVACIVYVEEKEVSRHSEKATAFEDEHAAHKRQEEAHGSEGGRGGGL